MRLGRPPLTIQIDRDYYPFIIRHLPSGHYHTTAVCCIYEDDNNVGRGCFAKAPSVAHITSSFSQSTESSYSCSQRNHPSLLPFESVLMVEH